MTDLQAFDALYARLGVKVESTTSWRIIEEPHAITRTVCNNCSKTYDMNSVYFFDAAGKFVCVGTWE